MNNTLKATEIRGSEWRKWDLHVHTPASLCSEYGGQSDEIWTKFFETLEELSEEIKVIGINDYLFLDGYEKVLEYKRSGGLKNIELVLPVIEFRIKEFVGNAELNRINYHIIFADDSILSVAQIKTHFLTGLFGKANLDVNSTENYTWGGVITRETLIDFGKHIYESIPVERRGNANFLEIGFNNLNFDTSKIESLLGEGAEPNLYLKDKYFKAIGKAEWEDFRWAGSIAEKKTIINNTHFVFSASPTAEKAYKGKQSLENQKVNSRLLHCSDAHMFAVDAFKTNPKELGHCFTWIKADTTFEGLKQIIHEPDERVKIQTFKPDVKNDRHIISKLEFIDSGNLFGNQRICLNENLNAIIGGKSSGKSLLMYAIANSIDPDQVVRTSKKLNFDGYKFQTGFDFKVIWKNGDIDLYSDTNKDAKQHKITYIPQLYINHLVEKNNKQELNSLIQNILLQDKTFTDFSTLNKGLISDVTTKIESQLSLYLSIRKSLIENLEKQKTIGKSDAIRKSIENLEKEIAKGQIASNLKPEEFEEFNKLQSQKTENESKTKLLELTDSVLQKVVKEVIASRVNLLGTGQEKVDFPTKGQIDRLLENISESNLAIIELRKQIEIDFDVLIANLNGGITKFEISESKINLATEFAAINEKIKPFLIKIEGQKELLKLTAQIKLEKEKLEQSLGLERQFLSLKKEYDEIRIQTSSLLKKRFDLYKEIEIEVNKTRSDIGSDITLNCSLIYKKENLLLFEQTNKNQLKDSNRFHTLFDENLVRYDEIIDLYKIQLSVSDEKLRISSEENIPIKSKINLEDILRGLIKDSFDFDYSVTYKGDDLLSMSPGKKGTVLLILFLEISSSEHPILIDQPEDNLDNRTIYDLLCKMIKENKKDRQIIIVSHNANLVVATDSENIIVANQEGQGVELLPKRFRFEYTNGALENTRSKDESNANILDCQGIKEHVCDILEGGNEAFKQRERKYSIK